MHREYVKDTCLEELVVESPLLLMSPLLVLSVGISRECQVSGSKQKSIQKETNMFHLSGHLESGDE